MSGKFRAGDGIEPSSASPDRPSIDYHHRTTVNLIAAIVIILLGTGIYLTLHYMDENRKNERCIATGRRDCFAIPDQANQPAQPQR